MNFLNDIKEESIIICSNNYKKYILSLNKLLPIKIYNLDEFKRLFYFDYDEDTIIYIVNKYNVKYDVAKVYIDNLYYIDKDNYNIKKLDFLCKLKSDLIKNNLLIFNNYFKDYITNKKIYVYEEDDSLYIKNMLKDMDYLLVSREYSKYDHNIYEFDTMEEEIEYIANEICILIDKGIDISKIKLMNVDDSYINTINRIFSLFNLKIDYEYKSKLSSYIEVKEFINNYKNTSLEESLSKLDNNFIYYDNLIDVINKYNRYNNKDLLIYKINNSYIFSTKYDNAISCVDYKKYISNNDEYIFLINFNNGSIPNYYKDTSYISDNISILVNKDTSSNLNSILRNKIINSLGDIKNLVITYKHRDSKNKYNVSNLYDSINSNKIDIDYKNYYSKSYNEMKLASLYDNYIKYGVKDKNYDILNYNYSIPYNTYNNKFSGIDRVFDKLKLSYTKMQVYNKCSFRYYLSSILNLDIYEENFSTVIGSMVHYVMEKCLSNKSMDTNKYADEYLLDKSFTNKEKFFLNRYKLLIKELLDECILEHEYMLFNEAMYEKSISVDISSNVKFVGIIDKVLYYIENNKTYIALIDYKTGNDEISLKYLRYGLNMQLPIYLYLAKRLDFNNPIYTGFYLQRFNIIDRDYRLLGYSNSDKDILSKIDSNYDNSKIIKGLKTLKDGSFAKYSKVLSNEEIDDVIDITEKKILETVDNIKNNKFDINPKVIDNINIGCMFCKFKDICYVTEGDKVIIDTNGCDDNGIH